MPLVKEFAIELAFPLCMIINAAIQSGRSPTMWKDSYVTPVPKIPTPMTFGDLRPLTLTLFASLLCESFVNEWMYADIAPNIDPQQFGNVKSSSTTHCLIDFLDFTYSELEKRKTAVTATFIDFRKAFDLVDHTNVIKKAISMGVRESLIPWLCDFLTDRRQSVRLRGAISDSLPITCGVPQGTKSGPLGFLILINDALIDTPQRYKYVDDCTIASSINITNPDHSPLQGTLDSLQQWTTDNHVTINAQKSVTMFFSFAKRPPPPPSLTIGANTLETVATFKLLGVTIDNQLKFDPHVANIVKSASYRLHMLRRLKSFGVPPNELVNIYKTFIIPKLTYASPAWSPSLGILQLKRLERVQKRALRISLGPNYISYENALNTTNLPRLAYDPAHPRPHPPTLYEQILSKFALRLADHPRHRNLLPPILPTPENATRHQNQIRPIRSGTNRYQNSPIPTMVSLLNKGGLPHH